MSIEVLPDMHLIRECGPDRQAFARSRNRRPVDWFREGREVHIPQNAYLLLGDEKTLLFDTLSPASGEVILARVAELLAGRGLDYLVVSHPDVPHAGNTPRILDEHPECELVAPAIGVNHELYHLEDAIQVGPGDRLDLGGHDLEFVEATFLDAPIHIWMRERGTETLFTVDWLGIPHMDDECTLFADELELSDEEWISRLIEFHGRVMFWFEYVNVDRVQAATRHIREELAPQRLAPAHGAFVREEADRILALMEPTVEAVATHGSVGALG